MDKMDKRYSPAKNYITPLNKILQNNKLAISTITSELKKRGYAFIRLDDNLVKQIDECVNTIESFFDKPKSYKKQFEKEPIFGYYDVQHKESFRFLTGSRLSEQRLPVGFQPIQNMIHKIDNIMHTITLLCAPDLFPDIMVKSEEFKIPMFDSRDRRGPWSMFDMVKYLNDGTRSKEQLNCKEHMDPGLFSFSLRSTEPGLQLADEFGEWIKPPQDKTVGIIWAGQAATKINPKIKPGYHRVVNPPTALLKPRISMWHEICTASQERLDLMGNTKQQQKVYQSTTGLPNYKSIQNIDRSVEPKSDTEIWLNKVHQHLRQSELKVNAKASESSSGIPVSKSLPPDRIKTGTTESLPTEPHHDMFVQDLTGRGPGWFKRSTTDGKFQYMNSTGHIQTV